jgi:D-inositol-3-phosphate glycosyltransferase
VQRRSPRRIATISLHTSPLDQPGTGDAGGLNVYVVEVSKRLAEYGIEVEIFTRAVCRDTPPTVELVPGVLVRNVVAGPFEELDKNALPGQICEFTFEVLRAEAAHAPGRYDLLHAHYWLSGQVAARAAERCTPWPRSRTWPWRAGTPRSPRRVSRVRPRWWRRPTGW